MNYQWPVTKFLIVAGGLATAGAVQALAADPISVAPVTTDYSWTGSYVGLVGGVNRLLGDTNIPNYNPTNYNADSTSGTIGAQGGYQYQFANKLVLGAEARFVAVFNDGSEPTSSTERINVGANYQGDVVAKLGYAMGRFLPYVKGGAALVHLNDVGYSGPVLTNSLDQSYVGWTVGTGLDYALNKHWIVGVDYAYADFGSHDFHKNSSTLILGPTNVSPVTHTLSLSLNYKF